MMFGRSVLLRHQPLSDGGWVVTTEDITERSRYEAHITHLAHYDPLTDLPNRALFRERLEQKFKLIDRTEPFAVLYIDLDDFKRINDSLGHPIGDELLKAVAVRLRQCLTGADSVARLGGDEFAIVRSDVARESDLDNLAEMILATVHQPYDCVGHRISVDASIGIALAPRDGAELDELLKNADLAMYAAKS